MSGSAKSFEQHQTVKVLSILLFVGFREILNPDSAWTDFLDFISIQLFVFVFMNESILGQKVLPRLEAGRISQLKLLSLPKENRHIWVNKNIANLCWICHFS